MDISSLLAPVVGIGSILLGDLIYDSYLTRNKKQRPTININDNDFREFLLEFISLFFAWKEIIRNNKEIFFCKYLSIYYA